MKCSEVTDWMQRYLDNDLQESEREKMHEHLRECTSCAEMFDRLNRLSDELVSLPKVVPPISLVDAILPRLDEIDRQQRSAESAPLWRKLRKRVPYRAVGGVAAACVLIALMAIQKPWFNAEHNADDTALMNSAADAVADSAEAGAASAGGASSGAASLKMYDQKGTAQDRSAASRSVQDSKGGGQEFSSSVEPSAPAAPDAPPADRAETADGGIGSGRSSTGAGADHGAYFGADTPVSDGSGQKDADSEAAEFHRFTEAEEIPQLTISSGGIGIASFDGMQPLVSPDGRYSAMVEATEDGEQVVVLDENDVRIYASPLKPAGSVTRLTWEENSQFVNYAVTETNPDTGEVTVTEYVIEVEARRETRLVDP